MQTTSGSRVAFAMSGNAWDPAAFSGLPASLCRALSDLGVTVVPIDVELPGPWQRLLVNALTLGFIDAHVFAEALRAEGSLRLAFRANKPKLLPSREMTAVRSAVAQHRLRRGGPVERAISWGTEFRLPADVDYITLDDATIVQLRRSWSYHWMQNVSEQPLRRMIARQRQVYAGARACCFVTHRAGRSAVEDYSIPDRRVRVVGCGANRDLEPLDRDWTAPRFLFVGKDFGRKNGPSVVRAFAEVRRRHPSARLDLVGSHPRIEQAGVIGHGFLSLDRPADVARVNDLFQRATCFVMPSLAEPAGYVFAEALSAGVGSIGPENGGSATIIGDAGVTVHARDLASLTEQMLRFCDPSEAQQFAASARARAPRFTWRATAERIVRSLELAGFDHSALAEPL